MQSVTTTHASTTTLHSSPRNASCPRRRTRRSLPISRKRRSKPMPRRGAVSALTSQRGYLTDKASGAPMTLAMNFVRNNVAALGLEAADLQGYAVTDVVHSKVTGATHIYLQQRYRGIPVYNAQLQVNVNRDGRIISVNNSFLPGIARAVSSLSPRMQLPAAVGSAAQFSGTPLAAQPKALQAPRGMQQVHERRARGHLALADQRQADAAADPPGRGAPGVEFPDPYARRRALLGLHGRRRHRPGVDALRLGRRRPVPRVPAARGKSEPYEPAAALGRPRPGRESCQHDRITLRLA